MRRVLFWTGWVLCALGAAVVVASLIMKGFGVDASYNFGDPAKFQFVLVPFWQIGLAIAVLGGLCLLLARWVKSTRPT
jgi:hypothetical protein